MRNTSRQFSPLDGSWRHVHNGNTEQVVEISSRLFDYICDLGSLRIRRWGQQSHPVGDSDSVGMNVKELGRWNSGRFGWSRIGWPSGRRLLLCSFHSFWAVHDRSAASFPIYFPLVQIRDFTFTSIDSNIAQAIKRIRHEHSDFIELKWGCEYILRFVAANALVPLSLVPPVQYGAVGACLRRHLLGGSRGLLSCLSFVFNILMEWL